jgi:hypothetical protein
MTVGGRTTCTLLSIVVALLCLGRPGWADETPKKDGRTPALRGAGRIVEEGELAGREFAHDASQVGREAWAKAKEASAAAAEEVRRATHEFWRDVLEEKARLRAKLRRENAELRARRGK